MATFNLKKLSLRGPFDSFGHRRFFLCAPSLELALISCSVMDSFGQDVQAVAVAERPTSLPSSNARTNLRTDSNYRLGQNRYHPYADAAEARMERVHMVGTLQSDFTSTNIWRRSQLRVFTETNRRAMRYHPYHKDVFHESLNPCQPLI